MSSTGTRAAIFVSCLALLASLSGCVSPEPVEPADLVLRGGVVVTVDDALPEAEAIAIAGYQIVAVGSNPEINAYVGRDTEVIDLAGRLAIPGLIEGHGHFMSIGWAKMSLDLAAAATWDEIVELVREAAREAEPGDWIFGRGWHQEKWSAVPEPTVDGVPLHHGLSEVSPNNPVSLSHASGHAMLVNDAALRLAGIDANTPDPAGGTIVRDDRGNATGLLREAAEGLISARVEEWREKRSPEQRAAEARRMMEMAGQDVLSKGITSFQDAGSSFDQIDQFLFGECLLESCWHQRDGQLANAVDIRNLKGTYHSFRIDDVDLVAGATQQQACFNAAALRKNLVILIVVADARIGIED